MPGCFCTKSESYTVNHNLKVAKGVRPSTDRRPTIKPTEKTNGQILKGLKNSNLSGDEIDKENSVYYESFQELEDSVDLRYKNTSVSIFNEEVNIEIPNPTDILKNKSVSGTHLVQASQPKINASSKEPTLFKSEQDVSREFPSINDTNLQSKIKLESTLQSKSNKILTEPNPIQINRDFLETKPVIVKNPSQPESRELSLIKSGSDVIEDFTLPTESVITKDSLLSVPSTTESLSASSSYAEFPDFSASRNNSGSGSEDRPSIEDDKVVRKRRSGIPASAPDWDADITAQEDLPVYPKSLEDEEKIKKAIEKNDFLNKILSGKTIQEVINAMELVEVSAKHKIIKQGDKGHEMYVSKEGSFRTTIKGKQVGEFSDVRVFGELAILYNAKRLASITAITNGKVWVLQQKVYQKIVIRSNIKEQDENLKFLQNVKSLNIVDIEVLRQVANLLKAEFFQTGTQIIRQGDKGDKFYIIRAGIVSVLKSGVGVVGQLGKGKYFGEIALQKEDTRQATVVAEPPGVDCLTLTRSDFISLFGDVEIPTVQAKLPEVIEKAQIEYLDIKMEDLKIIKTLGVGGFGRVELVQHKRKKDMVFALKYLKKIDIVYQQQQEHVYNEKFIQLNCKSPFIVRLYRTFKDPKYVYFLMETCLGGDLFSLLHRQKDKRFDDRDAKFLSACVLEAFEYLHSKGIVYRDLKPENLLVDKRGYLKLTDFGFAKKMPARGRTFTFAGTPEYVAPEIVLNKGHDKAVDYWAFGSFIFELLTGRTPFRTGDSSHMRTYNKILQGIDNVNFPGYINLKARNLIEKLCRPVAAERLGMQRGGTKDIKNHKWYQTFDWPRFQQGHYNSPFKPKLTDFTDTKYFDQFKQDKDYPPDETSGWDINF